MTDEQKKKFYEALDKVKANLHYFLEDDIPQCNNKFFEELKFIDEDKFYEAAYAMIEVWYLCSRLAILMKYSNHEERKDFLWNVSEISYLMANDLSKGEKKDDR